MRTVRTGAAGLITLLVVAALMGALHHSWDFWSYCSGALVVVVIDLVDTWQRSRSAAGRAKALARHPDP